MKTEPKPELSPELIQKAQAGDQGAMTALYEATHQEVYRTVHAMVRDEDLTLDIQQDAYVQAFSHLDQLREPENFLPWLRQIAVNRTRSLMRKRTPLLFSQLELGDADEGLEIPDLSPENSPELALDRKETNRLIREILGELSDAQRMLVGMYYYEQIPVGKIAEDLGISPGSVKTQLFRSRKKLEARVRQLESQGVKLFGLSPIPFLLGLLKKAEPPATAEGKALAGVLTQSTASTASTTVKAVAVHTGRSFFQTALGRVTLGVLAAAALGGGILGYGRIKDKLLIGDYQPPTPVESDENLSTEPTETVKYETPEDLTTEPLVTESTETLTTAPTEADSTEPKPAQPTDPTEPVGAGDHNGPEPDQMNPPQPSAPAPPEPSETVPSFESNQNNQPRVVRCSWDGSGIIDIYDQPWGSTRRIQIIVENGTQPYLYTDNDKVVQLRSEGEFYGESVQEGQRGYYWAVTFLGSGTAHIYCELNFSVTHVLSVTNPEYPETILEVTLADHSTTDSIPLKLDERERIMILVQGMAKPTIYTDHPEIVKADYFSEFFGSQTNWIHKGYYLDVTPVKPGTAHIYIGLNGKVYKTYTVTVEDDYHWPQPTEPPTEPPIDPTETTKA